MKSITIKISLSICFISTLLSAQAFANEEEGAQSLDNTFNVYCKGADKLSCKRGFEASFVKANCKLKDRGPVQTTVNGFALEEEDSTTFQFTSSNCKQPIALAEGKTECAKGYKQLSIDEVNGVNVCIEYTPPIVAKAKTPEEIANEKQAKVLGWHVKTTSEAVGQRVKPVKSGAK